MSFSILRVKVTLSPSMYSDMNTIILLDDSSLKAALILLTSSEIGTQNPTLSAVYITPADTKTKLRSKSLQKTDRNKRISALATSKFCTVYAVTPALTPYVAIKYIVPPVWH